ncbi:MAG: phosphoenolpyruvate carboxykinase (GTP) [Armatimonadaceae bacterium]
MSFQSSPSQHIELNRWVEECIRLCQPESVYWCDGSEAEKERFLAAMVEDGSLLPLHSEHYPGCYLYRSDPRDVARTEKSTYICTRKQEDAGPFNNWMSPDDARERLTPLFAGSMRGKTMYVIPYVMGPVGSPFSKVGVEITDSAYVVLSMRTMTRMGTVALEQLGTDGAFVPGLHATGTLDAEQRFICHFPEERLIWSINSNYGGNALLGKKCFALRIASAQAHDEGWLAEHMLLLELTSPDGDRMYFAGAFPSACGKTNLAMLVVPPALAAQGWKARTIGDDIAWMRIGEDGRLWAVNPEAGFFGVAPGTSEATNPTAMATVRRDTIFTNVAVSDDGMPWWEGMNAGNPPPYEYLTDWLGNRRSTSDTGEPFAHPNSRFTAPAINCPTLSPHWDDAQGVPISAILLGGRRLTTVPLVMEAFSWQHGVFLGSIMGSRTTAAADGATGILRRDPMAMLPFCGYNMGAYFAHWLQMGKQIPHPPHIFHVNWFRQDSAGKFLWPGFGENVRTLIWMRQRIRGEAHATETVAGLVPSPEDLPMEGLTLPASRLEAALAVNRDDWQAEAEDIEQHFARFGSALPPELRAELDALKQRLS